MTHTTTREELVEFRTLVDLYVTALQENHIEAEPRIETMLSSIAELLGIREQYSILREPPRIITGAPTTISTPTRTIAAHYAVIELDDLIPSHSPFKFSPLRQYPHGCQQRDYTGDEAERLKVIMKSGRNFNPSFLLTNTPVATDGPPVVTKHGFVLGGNARTMMLVRTYEQDDNNRFEYNRQLLAMAALFGLSTEQLQRMTYPVLVRLVDVDLSECALYSNILNTNHTQSVDATTHSVSVARQLNEHTQERIADLFLNVQAERMSDFWHNSNATIRLAQLLRTAEIITDTNHSLFFAPGTRAFSDQGKLLVEGILLASVLEDRQIIEAARSYTAHIFRSIPFFVRMKHYSGKWNLIPTIREVMLLEHERRASGLPKDMFITQGTFERPFIEVRTQQVWDLLDLGVRKFASAIFEYLEFADAEHMGGGFDFVQPHTPDEILERIHRKYVTSSLGDAPAIDEDKQAFLELLILYAAAQRLNLFDAEILPVIDHQLETIAELLVIPHHELLRLQAKVRYEHYRTESAKNRLEISTREHYLRDMKKEVRKREFPGFFPTETPVVRRMIEEVNIEPGMCILEPSAGSGAIADVLMHEYGSTCLIDTCESNNELRELLLLKGHHVAADNFLQYNGRLYDVILMNPPFENRLDVLHVRHAYSLLKRGGTIVSIMSAGVFGSSQPLFRDFVDWIKERGYHEALPEGSFKESDTDVRAHFVVITKPDDEQSEEDYQFESLHVSAGDYIEDELTGQQYTVLSNSGGKIVIQEVETLHQLSFTSQLPQGAYRKITYEELQSFTRDNDTQFRRNTTNNSDRGGSRFSHRDRGDYGQPDNATDRGSGNDRTALSHREFNTDVVIVRPAYTWRPTQAEIDEFLAEHVEVNLKALFWYQTEGVMAALRGLDTFGGFLNTDGTGVGKTAQQLAIAYLLSKRSGKPALIVTKSREIISDSFVKARRFLNIPFHYFSGTLRPGVNICTYHDLVSSRFQKVMEYTVPYEKAIQTKGKLERIVTEQETVTEKRFKVQGKDTAVVIFDESHMLINKTTHWTTQGMLLVNEAPYVAFFSATPLDKLEHLHYLKRTGIYKNQRQFERMMRSLGFELAFRKTKDISGITYDKPYYRRIVGYPLVLTAIGLEALFEDLTEDGGMIKRELALAKMDIKIIRGILPAQAHAVMKQIEAYWVRVALMNNVGLAAYAGVILQRMRTELEPYKVRFVLNLIDRELQEGRSIVVFVDLVNDQQEPSSELNRKRRATLNILREVLEQRYGRGSTVTITGNESERAIERNLALFQSNRVRILLTTPTKGGTGLNLDDVHGTAPRTGIVITAPLSARILKQMEGRTSRATTKTQPRMYFILSDAPVDKRVADILEVKLKLLAAAVSGSVENLDLEGAESEAEQAPDAEKMWVWFEGVKTLVDGKKRFRKLSHELHPDTNPNSNDPEGERFKQMTDEYEKWKEWIKTHQSTPEFGKHRLFKNADKQTIHGKKYDKPFNAAVFPKSVRTIRGRETTMKYILVSGRTSGTLTLEMRTALREHGFEKYIDLSTPTNRTDQWEAPYTDERWMWVLSLFEKPTPFYEQETEPAFTEGASVVAVTPSDSFWGGFDDENGHFVRKDERGTVVKVRERATSTTTHIFLYDVHWKSGKISRRLSSAYLAAAPIDPADMSEEEFVRFFLTDYTYEDGSLPHIIQKLRNAEKGYIRPEQHFVATKEELVALIRTMAEREARMEHAKLRAERDSSMNDDLFAENLPVSCHQRDNNTTAVIPVEHSLSEASGTITLSDARKLSYKPLPLAKRWKEVFGAVAKQFSMFIWGPPGSGKSTLLLQLCEAMSRFGELLYASAEEHLSRISERAKRLRIGTRRIHILTTTRLSDIRRQLATGRYAFVAIDSLNVLDCTSAELLELMHAFPNVVFIIIAQASKDMRTYRGTADLAHKVDIVVRVYKGVASVTKNRFCDLIDFPIFHNKHRELLRRRITRAADKPAGAIARTGELHRIGHYGSSSGSR